LKYSISNLVENLMENVIEKLVEKFFEKLFEKLFLEASQRTMISFCLNGTNVQHTVHDILFFMNVTTEILKNMVSCTQEGQ